MEGPGERSEPLDELGSLPPGKMVGLELLRLNRRMAGNSYQVESGRTECRRENAGGAPAEEIWKIGTVCRGRAEAIHSSSEERAPKQLAQPASPSILAGPSVVGCRAAAGGSWDRVDKGTGTDL